MENASLSSTVVSNTQVEPPPLQSFPPLTELAKLITQVDSPHDFTTIRMPFTGEVLGAVPLCTPEDATLALQRARAAQPAWAALPLRQRAAVFMRFHDILLKEKDGMMDLLQFEVGKCRLNALEESFDVAINARHYAAHAARYLNPRRRRGVIPLITHTVEYHHPLGVVGLISPWNYPLAMAISDALPALIAGNAVVLKPAEETPFVALYCAHLLYEAGLPREVFHVVTGRGRIIAPALLDGVNFLGFTGGTNAGRMLAAQAATRLVKTSLELGGKNPALVLNDADLVKSVEGVCRGAFTNTGQFCVHIERLYVQSGIYDRFVAALVERVRHMKVSAALDFDVDMASLISKAQLDKVSQHVEDAVAKGATLLVGGHPRQDLGPYFYEPTLLTGVKPGMDMYAEETFGPAIAIYKFDTLDEGIQAANDSQFGLNSSVWTRNLRLGRQIASRLKTGTVGINDPYGAAWASVEAPMGGMKASGIGRRHGREGIQKYTDSQNVTTQWVMPIGPLGILNPQRYAKVFILFLKVMRRIPFMR